MPKQLILFLIFFITLQANAFEDCIISTKGKLTDIRIENNEIIDVYPIVTVTNQKNTLMIHPLKTGVTAFTVIKNEKNKHIFYVKVDEKETFVKGSDEFSILTIDEPPIDDSFELDLPPEGVLNG